MKPILQVKNLTKIYADGTEAVKGISFSVHPGEVFGLVGPNGAGKSTTIKMITTLLKPTSGEIIVNDVDAVKYPFEARKYIAYLPEFVSGEDDTKVKNFLSYLANLYSINTGKNPKSMVQKALTIANLHEAKNKKLSELSKGMFRRLMIGATLMLDAPIIILDEPTSGVDVIESVRIRQIIRKAADEGKAIIFSSHNMLEVESLCDRVALMYNGKIVRTAPIEDIKKEYKNLEEVFVKTVLGDGHD